MARVATCIRQHSQSAAWHDVALVSAPAASIPNSLLCATTPDGNARCSLTRAPHCRPHHPHRTELVQQVLRVARALSGAGLRLRTAAFTGGQADDKARAASFRTQRVRHSTAWSRGPWFASVSNMEMIRECRTR